MLVYILLVTLAIVFLKLKGLYSYWENKGVKGPTPWPIVGNYGSVFMMRKSSSQILRSAYEQYPQEKVIGLYKGFKAVLLVRDPDIVKHILVKDFNNFYERGFGKRSYSQDDNLIVAEGNIWRLLRHVLTPAFNTKYLNVMIPLIQQCAGNYTNHIGSLKENLELDVDLLTSNYMTDVIGSCIFGLNLKVYSDREKDFMVIVKKICNPPLLARVFDWANTILPGFKNVIRLQDEVGVRKFFSDLVNPVIREREGKPKTRHDIMDLLIDLKEKKNVGKIYDGEMVQLEVDDRFIKAQALIFYTAGIETSSTTMAFLLYELALNQDIQESVYKEICCVLNTNIDTISYKSVKDMVYLRMVINEAIRKHTALGSLLRRATTDYNVPGTNITIDKGTLIRISAAGLHNDAKYFKNPEKFNPDNFSTKNLRNIPTYAFVPFGAGPRNCIGMRLAELAITIGTAAFLMKYKVEPSSRTKTKLNIDPKSMTLQSTDGLWLKIKKRQ